MDLTFTDEQRMLQDSLDAFLQRTYGFEQRRAMLARPVQEPSPHWQVMADELGILGACMPEQLGGLGGTPVDAMIIMASIGRRLALEPFLESVVLAGGVLRRSQSPLAAHLARQVIAGRTRIAMAYAEPQARYCWRDVATFAKRDGDGFVLSGHKAVVVGAPAADVAIVSARLAGDRRSAEGIGLFAIDLKAPSVERRDYRLIDGRPASELYLEGVRAPAESLLVPEDQGFAVLEAVLDEGATALCAEASGVLRELLQATIDYTKQRKQFGAPLSSFQVLQHRMVDMFIAVEEAVSMTHMATLHLDRPPLERARAVSAAKAKVGASCRFVGQSAIQLHGGMGITDELAVSHFFKRSTLIESQFGSTDHHLARYEQLALPEGGKTHQKVIQQVGFI